MLLTQDYVTFTTERLVWIDPYLHVEIALAATTDSFATTTEANRRAIIDTGGDLDCNRLLTTLHATPLADRTSLLWYLPTTLAGLARYRLLNRAKHCVHCPHTLASTFTIWAALEA